MICPKNNHRENVGPKSPHRPKSPALMKFS